MSPCRRTNSRRRRLWSQIPEPEGDQDGHRSEQNGVLEPEVMQAGRDDEQSQDDPVDTDQNPRPLGPGPCGVRPWAALCIVGLIDPCTITQQDDGPANRQAEPDVKRKHRQPEKYRWNGRRPEGSEQERRHPIADHERQDVPELDLDTKPPAERERDSLNSGRSFRARTGAAKRSRRSGRHDWSRPRSPTVRPVPAGP